MEEEGDDKLGHFELLAVRYTKALGEGAESLEAFWGSLSAPDRAFIREEFGFDSD